MNILENSEEKIKDSIHSILAHSYVFYFLFFLLGLIIHIFFPVMIYNHSFLTPLGLLFLIFGTFLIVWAQSTTRNLDKTNISKDTFNKGPYFYTHMPTQLGLFSLMFGLSFIVNSFFIFFFSFITLIIGKFFFIRQEEEILSKKYGAPYIEYKKSVKF